MVVGSQSVLVSVVTGLMLVTGCSVGVTISLVVGTGVGVTSAGVVVSTKLVFSKVVGSITIGVGVVVGVIGASEVVLAPGSPVIGVVGVSMGVSVGVMIGVSVGVSVGVPVGVSMAVVFASSVGVGRMVGVVMGVLSVGSSVGTSVVIFCGTSGVVVSPGRGVVKIGGRISVTVGRIPPGVVALSGPVGVSEKASLSEGMEVGEGTSLSETLGADEGVCSGSKSEIRVSKGSRRPPCVDVGSGVVSSGTTLELATLVSSGETLDEGSGKMMPLGPTRMPDWERVVLGPGRDFDDRDDVVGSGTVLGPPVPPGGTYFVC
jgi:hypothetical protein